MIKAIQITYEMPKGKGSSKLLQKDLNQILLIKTESFEDACLKPWIYTCICDKSNSNKL